MEGSKKSQSKLWCCKYHIIGVSFVAFGISLVLFLPDFVNNKIMQNLELRPDSRSYDEWKKPSIPLFFDIYLFNWTNPNQINDNSTKPILQELGPYRFRQQRDKHNITFSDDRTTVRYRQSSLYLFDKSGSNGTLDDVVNTVNMASLAAGVKAEFFNMFKTIPVNLILSSQSIYVNKTVREILFEGYYDPLLTYGKLFDSSQSIFDRVGFFVKQNDSDVLGGTYEAHTGVSDMSRFGKIVKFNDLTEFPYNKDECSQLKGSTGEFFPPKHSKDEILYLFTPDMCRSFPYDYEKNIFLHDIVGNRYVAGLRAIDNGTSYPENQCYVQNLPSGVLNISICNFNQPMFQSYPHFFLADTSYLNGVEGLSPSKEKHESFITLEPKTGIVLEVTARFQTNVLLRPYGSVYLYKNVPKTMMPLFHVESKFVMNEEQANQLRFGLLMLKSSQYFGFILVAFGILIIASKKLRKYCCCKHKVHEGKPQMHKEMHPLVK